VLLSPIIESFLCQFVERKYDFINLSLEKLLSANTTAIEMINKIWYAITTLRKHTSYFTCFKMSRGLVDSFIKSWMSFNLSIVRDP
jgi:hypothetical protein